MRSVSVGQAGYGDRFLSLVQAALSEVRLGRGFSLKAVRLESVPGKTVAAASLADLDGTVVYLARRQIWPRDSTITPEFAATTFLTALEEWTSAGGSIFPTATHGHPVSIVL